MYKNASVYYPQDEVHTVLLPVSLGCPHNKCVFCSMYKDDAYREVPFSQIENHLRNGDIYTEKVFLTGADPLAIGFGKMKDLLELIKKYFPYCACVASYASIRSISKYSLEDLSTLHDLGLRLLYIGFETGRDDVLKMIRKGHTVDQAIKEGQRLNQVKIPFNAIIIYGLAGKGQGRANAEATAKMLNEFSPKTLITMNLKVFSGTDLERMVERGDFIPPSYEERLVEIKTLLERLEPQRPMIFDTSHPTNLIKIKGSLPDDREGLLRTISSYL